MYNSRFDLVMVTIHTSLKSLIESLDVGMLTVNMNGIRERPNTDSAYVYQAKDGRYYAFIRDNFFMEPGDNYYPMPPNKKGNRT